MVRDEAHRVICDARKLVGTDERPDAGDECFYCIGKLELFWVKFDEELWENIRKSIARDKGEILPRRSQGCRF
jgi:hypothetical protein